MLELLEHTQQSYAGISPLTALAITGPKYTMRKYFRSACSIIAPYSRVPRARTGDYEKDAKRLTRAFGDVLREYRAKIGLSQLDLAAAVELDRSSISLFERGLHQPSFTIVVRVAVALGVAPQLFVEEIVRRATITDQAAQRKAVEKRT